MIKVYRLIGLYGGESKTLKVYTKLRVIEDEYLRVIHDNPWQTFCVVDSNGKLLMDYGSDSERKMWKEKYG